MTSRFIRLTAALLMVALSAVPALPHPVAAPDESNGGVRIMPLGDSITDGFNVPGGYRVNLWRSLADADHLVDFVGSGFNGPAELADHDHEGHPGWRIDEIDAQVSGWIGAASPRTVLLHIGTNDIVQNRDLGGAPARLSALIDRIAAAAPQAELFVATIIPLADPVLEARAVAYNAAIPGIVRSKAAAGGHVHLVDMHAAVTTADLADGVHPNRTGYDRMASAWYAALSSVPGSAGEDGAPPARRRPGPARPAAR
ncbi:MULTISPECIES: SGNH/GDSL hydrolase family protein [Streptosporangium]|uniref:Lysophospholipase L1-like esterase n=1 Tax=Streptosporangium brasiliense TaxID=47480 RepID=A0ABT9RLE9_9ACTN|nr:SGNH/GDSL hydrolase family protein [Streptosporangium brasiliense]MDP9869918.1 lysophospholipase L1-like esterase [Streptosporangium brasiliense]